MFKQLDRLIDGVTMYRLLLYYLLALVAGAAILSATGGLHYKPLTILIQAAVAVLACWIINKIFAEIFNAPTNYESSILTGLILALIIPPYSDGRSFLFILAASGLAMASKYLLTIKAKHIFNPAAIAVLITAYTSKQAADWWVGTSVILPIVVIGGLLVMRKIRREQMVATFFLATTLATIIYASLGKAQIGQALHDMVFASATFFLGFVMLTEPGSSPTTRPRQLIYAALIGLILPPEFHIGTVYTTPEMSLAIGNLFSYLSGSKVKLFPRLKQKNMIARSVVEFVFTPGAKLTYQPGQYMVWTLPHSGTDSRGNRRFFSLASSPTEPDIRLGVKFTKKGSSFKQALMQISQDSLVAADDLGGDFTLASNMSTKLAFIAGGIGITPYRSMLKFLIDKNQPRDIRMLYGARQSSDIVYQEILKEAQSKLGLRLTYCLSEPAAHLPDSLKARIDDKLIAQLIPDYQERLFYISGSQPLVASVQDSLRRLGVKGRHIKTDYFSGYA